MAKRAVTVSQYQGDFINLDRSTDRRDAMEAHLEAFGIEDRYRRFRAADGNMPRKRRSSTGTRT